MNSRLKKILNRLEEKNLEALIVVSAANITYLTKYPSRDSYLLVSKNGSIYFTDSRYIEEAKAGLEKGIQIKRADGAAFKLIAKSCLELKLKRIGFEERYLPFAEYKKIKGYLEGKARLVNACGLIEASREIKEPGEIVKIKKAIDITAQALEFIRKLLKPGQKELEVVAELERFIRYHGSSNNAFDIIVASGPNSSYPHHIPGQRRLQKREPVLIDIGVEVDGYKSDLTRVYFLGKIIVSARKIYDIVLHAQRRALEAIRPGRRIAEIDAAGRQYIAQAGYFKFFRHNLGHGIGLEVHEEPHISPKEKVALLPGMVFTVEPAIYLPHKFGIRIEDIVLVTEKKGELLSGALHK